MSFLTPGADSLAHLPAYCQHLGLDKQPYDEQMRPRNESFFGTADVHHSNLRELGHNEPSCTSRTIKKGEMTCN